MRAKVYVSSIAKNTTSATTFARNKSNFIENLMEIKSLSKLLLSVRVCLKPSLYTVLVYIRDGSMLDSFIGQLISRFENNRNVIAIYLLLFFLMHVNTSQCCTGCVT